MNDVSVWKNFTALNTLKLEKITIPGLFPSSPLSTFYFLAPFHPFVNLILISYQGDTNIRDIFAKLVNLKHLTLIHITCAQEVVRYEGTVPTIDISLFIFF